MNKIQEDAIFWFKGSHGIKHNAYYSMCLHIKAVLHIHLL